MTAGRPQLRVLSGEDARVEALLRRDERPRRVLGKALELERRAQRRQHKPPRSGNFLDEPCSCARCWTGFEALDVGEHGSRMHDYAIEGLVLPSREAPSRRRPRRYRLVAWDAPTDAQRARLRWLEETLRDVTESLAQEASGEPRPEDTAPLVLPADLFDYIVGLDSEKRELRMAIAAPEPVHVLFVGPPASAKSAMTSDLERLPRARMIVGGNATRAGLNDLLAGGDWPRVLIVDELDKAATSEPGRSFLAALLPIMETGRLDVLQAGRDLSLQRPVRVVATANETRRLPAPLLSRLWQIRLEPYSPEQMATVTMAFLSRRCGVQPDHALYIAGKCAPFITDVRRARDVARMYGGDVREVDRLVRRLREQLAAESPVRAKR